MAKKLTQFERYLIDYNTYAKGVLSIINKKGVVVPFEFNRMQRRFWQLFVEDTKNNKPVRWLVIKSRQLGSTTWFLGLFYWLTSLSKNKNALLVSHDNPSSENMGARLQNFYRHTPDEYRPANRKMNRSEIHFATSKSDYEKTGDMGLNSTIRNTTADSKSLGRSFTYQYVLCSEFAIWPEVGIDPEKVLVALGQTVAEVPGTCIILESTAMGENYAKRFWEDEYNGYRKIFISWIADEDYRKEISPVDYFELSDDRESLYGDEIDEYRNIKSEVQFWYPEYAPSEVEHEAMCRLNWRREMIAKKLLGNKDLFKQEYPTTVQDAFASTSTSLFNYKRLLEIRQDLGDFKNLERYRYQHDNNSYDHTRKFYQAKYGPLAVFEQPIEDQRYVIGGDGAQGITGGDYSSLVVLKVPQMIQVAQYQEIVPPEMFAGVANYLGILYNTALIGIESNDKGGYAAIDKLANTYNYQNLYYGEEHSLRSMKYGYVTNEITKSVMVTETRELITNNQITIYSNELLDQLMGYVKLPNGKLGCKPPQHDDLVIAFMIAIQMAKQIHIRTAAPPKRMQRGSLEYIMRHHVANREQQRGLRRG